MSNNNNVEPFEEPFEVFIKRAREEKGLSQEEVRKYLHLRSTGAVTHWEKGRTKMTAAHAVKYAEILDVSAEEILFRLFVSKMYTKIFENWEEEFESSTLINEFLSFCTLVIIDKKKSLNG